MSAGIDGFVTSISDANRGQVINAQVAILPRFLDLMQLDNILSLLLGMRIAALVSLLSVGQDG